MIVISIFLLLCGTIYYISEKDNSVEALSKYGSRGDEVKQIQTKLQQHTLKTIMQKQY